MALCALMRPLLLDLKPDSKTCFITTKHAQNPQKPVLLTYQPRYMKGAKCRLLMI